MGVVRVRDVCVGMSLTFVAMRVRVRFSGRVILGMEMSVVFVVNMGMRVLNRLVLMLMAMDLGEVKPHTDSHE
jgi:hypothetical protein